jgi:hypothetical protein
MGRVDIGPQPVPDGHSFGRPTQKPGVHVAVVEAGDDGVPRRVYDQRSTCAWVGVEGLDWTDGENVHAFNKHRAWGKHGPTPFHGQNDAVANQGAMGGIHRSCAALSIMGGVQASRFWWSRRNHKMSIGGQELEALGLAMEGSDMGIEHANDGPTDESPLTPLATRSWQARSARLAHVVGRRPP